MRILPTEYSAVAVDVSFSEDALRVRLLDGREISIPLAYFPLLEKATPEQRADFEIFGHGSGIHWPQIDEDLSVAGFLRTS